MRIMCLMLLIGLLPSAVRAQESFIPGVQICLDAAADFSPFYPTVELPQAREAAAVFSLPADHSHQKLSFTWIAADVGAAAPRDYRIATGNLALAGKHKGVLRLTGLKRPLPVGAYRLEVLVDDQPWREAEFSVIEPFELPEPIASPEPVSLDQLMPLEVGTVWTYEFLQEAAPDAQPALPAEQLDALGRLRSEVTVMLVSRDPQGYQFHLQHGSQATAREWWKLAPRGLLVTQRVVAGKLARVDPPQRLLAWPHGEIQTWHYRAADGAFEQQSKQWGPLPMTTPSGERLGYLVRVERHDPATVSTVERRFVPGVGLVREEIITALKGGRRVSRQQMTLTDKKLPQHLTKD